MSKLALFPKQQEGDRVPSFITYPKEYRGPKSIISQVKLFEAAFPELDTYMAHRFIDETLSMLPTVTEAEGSFAFPRWQKIGKTYKEALERIISVISQKYTFKNYRRGLLGPCHLRRHGPSAALLEILAKNQRKSDVLIIPAQFGVLHRGRTVHQVRVAKPWYELPLGAFEVCCMAFIHPERFASNGTLSIDCPGDEYAPTADGDFSYAPYINCDKGLALHAGDIHNAAANYGPVTGFLWPSLIDFDL